ncbi:Uncharacterised protein [Serratia quinivorans]|nr:Uncharacterised protein [Serratia quinivorans]
MGIPRFTADLRKKPSVKLRSAVIPLLKSLGVSAHSLYKWLRAIRPDNSVQHARDLLEAKSEIMKLRAQLKRTEEERDILGKAARYFERQPD